MSNNPSKDNVYRKLDELREAIELDSYNLTRDQQDMLDRQLQDLRFNIDTQYEVQSINNL